MRADDGRSYDRFGAGRECIEEVFGEMSERARQFPPDPELGSSVDTFWCHARAFRDHVRESAIPPTFIFPDGSIDLIFYARRAAPDGAVVRARLFVAGASETAYAVTVQEGESYVGVRFRPGMSRTFVDAAPASLLGRDVDAADLDGRFRALEEKLTDTASPAAALSLLRSTLRASARDSAARAAPHHARSAITMLGLSGADTRVSSVAHAVGTSVRALHRDLVAWTGLSPRKLSRIFRFQAVLAMLRSSPKRSLSAIAYDVGYADHPHMTRDFRLLAGVKPSTLRADRGGDGSDG